MHPLPPMGVLEVPFFLIFCSGPPHCWSIVTHQPLSVNRQLPSINRQPNINCTVFFSLYCSLSSSCRVL